MREQLEHDRVIRLLQAKYKRKFEVGINPGRDQTTPVGTGPTAWYPDLVLQSPERGRKLLGVVEVETTESVNHLEAMSQWAAFSRLRGFFHLYVPTSSIDAARRLCAEHQINVAEMWAYSALGGQVRFAVIQRMPQSTGARKPDIKGPRAGAPVAGVTRNPRTPRRTPTRPRVSPRARVKPAASKRASVKGGAAKHVGTRKGSGSRAATKARKRK